MPDCRMCNGFATIFMHHGGMEIGYTCFPCADAMMLRLGVENMRGGASLEVTVAGYRAWRRYVGEPCTDDEVAKFAADLRRQKEKRPRP